MKNKDVIKLFGHSMMIEYGATGQTKSINVLPLNSQVRFSMEGDTIFARCNGDREPSLIERFASQELARNAFQHLQSVIQRYVFIRRLRNASARVMLWGVAPLVALGIALSANLAVTRGMEARAAAVMAPAAVTASAPPAAAAPVHSPSELAKAMQDGARAGKFSISVSTGKRGTLYVFSDPSCSYCKSLEPELEKLGNAYTIHLFPVSVVGGARSAERVSSVMCKGQDTRRDEWKSTITSHGSPVTTCPEGDEAISANDMIFRAMGLRGTPAIIRADGQVLPDSIPNTATAISKWLDETEQ